MLSLREGLMLGARGVISLVGAGGKTALDRIRHHPVPHSRVKQKGGYLS